MDNQERFDQIENMLVDLLRKQDQHSDLLAQIIKELGRQGEALSRQGGAIERQGEAINSLGEAIDRQGKLLTVVSEQVDGIIDFLKLSEARHTETERRQDAMLAELTRVGQRSDAAVEGLRILLQRQQTTDTRLDSAVQTQLQMMQLMRMDAETVAQLTQRFPALEGQEPRIQRLEDEVFRNAS